MERLRKIISETVRQVLFEMAASTTPKANTYITHGFAVDTKEMFRHLVKSGFHHEVFRHTNKPLGGLWGSPTDSDFGWKDFCQREEFDIEKLGTYTLWKLKESAVIYVIDSVEDFKRLLDEYGYLPDPRYKKYVINYNEVSEDYDGIFLTNNGNLACHDHVEYKDGYSDLMTWDCESIVVWNPNVIEILETNH